MRRSLYNNIKPPSWLGPNTDFHLFKEGIEPKWEDPTCEHGGKWTVLVPRGPNNKQTLDTYWLNAVRALLPVCTCSKILSRVRARGFTVHIHTDK